MRKIYFVIIVAVVVAVSFLYILDARKSIFPEKLGDMTLVRYETGEIAARQISSMYGLKDIPLAKGYSAVYRGRNDTMWIWVAESENPNSANDAFNAMNSRLGASTGHGENKSTGDLGQVESHNEQDAAVMNQTKPVKVDMLDLLKPEVYRMHANNVYNYYYLKTDYRIGRVYWIIFNSPDKSYQLDIVKESLKKI